MVKKTRRNQIKVLVDKWFDREEEPLKTFLQGATARECILIQLLLMVGGRSRTEAYYDVKDMLGFEEGGE